ncbi:MAG: DedA family protein [Labilithrix sp.]|nr:DedA family protein [Labilithrix sp.]
MLESFVVQWGYLAVGIGVFFEGETIVLIAGAMAHRGLLSLPWLIGAAFLGSLLGDQVWFFLGRRYGKGLIARRPAWKQRATRAEGLLARYGTLFVLAFRFLYGLRTVTPVMLGALGYPVRRFVVLNALSAAIWAASFSIAGYAVGASFVSLLGRAGRVEELVLAAVGLAVVFWFASRRASARAKEVKEQ